VVKKGSKAITPAAQSLFSDYVFESLASRCFGYFGSFIPVRSRLMTLSPAHALLIDKGLSMANDLHRFLSETQTNNPALKWNHKFLFLALLGYASSMARFSELDKQDFMALAEGFYDNVEIEPKKAS
jgi:hypothetical protein